jgi:Domain of unknown function (DUF4307)
VTTDLDTLYGARPGWQRPVTVALAVTLAVVGLGWLAWTAWYHSTPDVESELVSYDVVDDHEARARLQVTLGEGVAATCRIRAFAEDRTMVGELAFEPAEGVNDVVVRTERLADNVEKVGCTAPGQDRPR